ncbi:MAG TPA: thiamine diphosphokinase [Anaerolineaceae bacterium]|nr:thiamine diphosphokinase [Anaerolineaceae bacterium]
MKEKTVILFANGEFEKSERIMEIISQSALIVAIDGGVGHVIQLGLSPNIIIGDLDSVDQSDLATFEENGVDIKRYPTQKDETDLELAIEYVLDLGFDQVFICGASGGREDHFLGNILLISNPVFMNKDIKILTKKSEIFYCSKNQQINGNPGDLVSLIPISEKVTGINTKGLEFSLKNEELIRWTSRGISNVMVNDLAQVKYESGSLLCVHIFKF